MVLMNKLAAIGHLWLLAGLVAVSAAPPQRRFKKIDPAELVKRVAAPTKLDADSLARVEKLEKEMLEIERNFNFSDHSCFAWQSLESDYRKLTGHHGPASREFLSNCEIIKAASVEAMAKFELLESLARDKPEMLEEFSKVLEAMQFLEESGAFFQTLEQDYHDFIQSNSGFTRLLDHIESFASLLDDDKPDQQPEMRDEQQQRAEPTLRPDIGSGGHPHTTEHPDIDSPLEYEEEDIFDEY